MAKKEKKVNISGNPKHSLDTNRSNGSSSNSRSAATVRRLHMYNNKPKRDRKGKILKHDFQSKELPSTRIQPDSRWFGNARVVNQKELEIFREELQDRMSSGYNVLLQEKKLPLSLLNDHQKVLSCKTIPVCIIKMTKKKEKKVNTSRKLKHSLDTNRKNRTYGKSRSASTVRRLRMYKNKPMRNRKGKIMKHQFQSKDLPNTRIRPDRRYFGNTHVVSQKELEFLREELQSRILNT